MKSEWIENMIKKDDTFEYNYWKKKNFLRKKGRENNQFDTSKISSETFTVKLNFIETTSRLIYIPPLNLFLLSIRIPFRITIDPFIYQPTMGQQQIFRRDEHENEKVDARSQLGSWEVSPFDSPFLDSNPSPSVPNTVCVAYRFLFSSPTFHSPRDTGKKLLNAGGATSA